MTIKSFFSLADLQRRIGRFPIELPAAAMMGGAIMFVTFALPDGRFEGMLAVSGLGDLLSAAQPSPGQTARLLVAMASGGVAFLVVWAVLRALDGPPSASSFPAFRSADLHPDAPRRRPISAGREFGVPVDEAAEIGALAEDVPKRGVVADRDQLPSFLTPQQPAAAEFTHEPPTATGPAATMRDADEDACPQPEPLIPPLRFRPAVSDQSVPNAFLPLEQVTTLPSFLQLPEPLPTLQNNQVSVNDQASMRNEVSTLMTRLENGLTQRGSRPDKGRRVGCRDEESHARAR